MQNGDEATGRILNVKQLPKLTKIYVKMKIMQIEINNNYNI